MTTTTTGMLPPRLRAIILIMAERAQSKESPRNSFVLPAAGQTIRVATARHPDGDVVTEPDLDALVAYGLLEEQHPRTPAASAELAQPGQREHQYPRTFTVSTVAFEFHRQLLYSR